MERNEVVLSKDGEAFIDRSKVRILLCDNDAKSSKEVFKLLCECSYQVTAVRSARQVIDALNAEGPDIDIILSEVDLPMAKGLKMLKYLMRDKELRRIPVIMMSAQDNVSVVVKCLKLGAADYLVKPLRTNELFNLWTHMWRRRQMLGLAEKNIFKYDIDLVASDPSDANTNSANLFSDDTDEKSRKSANLEMCVSTHQEDEASATTVAASVEPPLMPGINERQTEQFSSYPKKSELKIGESSAFFTYVKSGMFTSNTQGVAPADENAPQQFSIDKKLATWTGQVCNDTQGQENREACENHFQGDDLSSTRSIHDPLSVEMSSTPPERLEFPRQGNNRKEEFSQVHVHPRNESHHEATGFHARTAYPYFISGVMNQVMMSSSAQLYQKNLQDLQNHITPALLPQYNHISQCPPHVPGLASFPCYPVSTCLQRGQIPTTHPLPSYGSPSSTEGKLGKVDRREAALIKFRQKRKERCFDKKIRYVNRKRLAERRPRVRGQFVRKMNGVNVDLNGQPVSVDSDEDEAEEDEEDRAPPDYSPEEDPMKNCAAR
ncbi:two-component response regulator-like APRR1 isoform X2 [Cornus florida]|uniref:two-component response regulator-like APRR1 isoform X2 n=1 Tax=Cornus florida TaxID=4283 RepID=UPI002896DB6B|nr:two-component response regulator-like APRR1 isoform X2 [Cornus florida]